MALHINIRKATAADIPTIHHLTEKIWKKHYPGIITQGQIDYMLGTMYSAEGLLKEMNEGHVFAMAFAEDKPAGYISVNKVEAGNYFLSKLYVDTSLQRKGVGSALLEYVIREIGLVRTIRLQVNRKNYTAINFYFMKGFVIEEVKDFDIGNNYFMNDFIMIKKLN